MIWSYLPALIGAIAAGLVEYGFKAHGDQGWVRCLWWAIPGALVVNWAVFQLIRDHGILAGFIVFSLGTALCRILSTLYIGDPVLTKDWLAFGLIFYANILKWFL